VFSVWYELNFYIQFTFVLRHFIVHPVTQVTPDMSKPLHTTYTSSSTNFPSLQGSRSDAAILKNNWKFNLKV